MPQTTRSAELFEQARRLLPGGVNSPVRAFRGVGGTPRFIARGAGAHLYDVEARNSILLPLLSLRLDKAILRDAFRFKDLEVKFDVGDGAIRPQPFELEATPFGIKVKEIEVGLDGTVNALVVPGLLPLRVKGTLDDPDVRPAPLAPFR